MEIKHCEFTGIKFDGQAIDSINTVAHALLNITELFKTQNIKIAALLKIQDNKSLDSDTKAV